MAGPKTNTIDLSAGMVPAQGGGGAAPNVDLSSGMVPAQSTQSQAQQSDPSTAPSFRQNVDSFLNNTEGDNALVRGLKGVGRVAVGIPEAAIDLSAPPKNPTEDKVNLLGPGAVAIKRLLYDPAKGQLDKAKQLEEQAQTEDPKTGNNFFTGTVHRANMHRIGAAVPLVGPWAADTIDRGLQGDVSGAATELATGYAIPKLAGKVAEGIKAASAPMAKTMAEPRGTIPAEAATPADLADYAKQHNIPATPAQLTEHNIPRNLQSVGERSTALGSDIRKQIKAGQTGVSTHVENLAGKMAPNIPDTEAAGNAIKQNITDALDREQIASRQLYSSVDQKAKGVTVDLRPVKQLADQLSSQSSFIRDKASPLSPKRGSAILQAANKLPDNSTFTNAADLRSALIDEAQHPDNVINDQAQGWIKSLTKAVDDQMMTSATGNAALEQSFRSANDHWKGLQENFNNPRSPLYQALKEPDPGKVPGKFLAKGQTGGSPHWLQKLDAYGIDKSPLKAELLRDLSTSDFKIKGKSLGGYDDKYLRSLYAPDELDHVYKTGALARSISRDMNPSNTAAMEQAASEIQNPYKAGTNALAAKGSLAKRMTRSGPTRSAGAIAAGLKAVGSRGAVAASMSERSRSEQ